MIGSRRGGGYGRNRYRGRYSYDDLDDPYDDFRGGDRYRRSRSRDRLANAVEGLAGAVDDAGEDRRYRRHRHHGRHHRRHHHHGRRYGSYGRRRYGSYTPRHCRSRSVDFESEWSDSDDGYDGYGRRYRDRDGQRRSDDVVDDLADTLQRAQLLRVLGERDRDNQRLMREVIRNTC